MTIQQRIDSVDATIKPARPTGMLQRACDCGQHTGGGTCGPCESKQSAASNLIDGSLPPIIKDTLRSSGRPLDTSTRGFMEQRIGHDFSQVRLHHDRRAAASAELIGARAYTVGNHIVFGAGAYSPGTSGGRRLMAHELTHTLQQRHPSATQTGALLSSGRGMDEQQADSVADAVVTGFSPTVDAFTRPSARIQRACGPAGIGTPAGCDPQPPTFVPGQHLARFNVECDDFAAGEQASLATFAGRIAGSGPVTVHGYASTDGDATFNQNLSCARAAAAQGILTANGVTAGRITVQRHGPTAGPAADRRSATVEAPIAPTPPTPAPPTPTPPVPTPLIAAFSTIDASSSPTGMPDRIPPRVDTIGAVSVIGFSPPMAPITISVDGAGGGNGNLTIDGAANIGVASSGVTIFRLRGTTQTSVGNAGNLRLVADQGGTRLATSNDFSVSSIPQNWTITFSSLVTGARRGIIVDDSWESDSGVVSDLDETEISEIIDTVASSGSLAGVGVTTSGFLPGDTFTQDEHSSPATITATGSAVDNQTSEFNDRRSSASNIPMTNSGYRIVTVILDLPVLPSVITTAKAGAAVTAGSVASGAGAGSVTRTQTIP